MSLFIDVTEPLSENIKEKFNDIIEGEKKDQPKPVRRICETCSKYLEYGELRYDKMEDGIKELPDCAHTNSALNLILMAVMNEALDEDQKAIEFLEQLTDSPECREFRQELLDFITLGKFSTLGQFDLLETAGKIIIDRYAEESTVTDTLSNMYLKVDNNDYLPVIHILVGYARKKFPDLLALESLAGFMHMKANDYQSALSAFFEIREKLSASLDHNHYINDNLASVWDNISLCHLKLGDAAKTIEACDKAMEFDSNAIAYKLGLPVLYRKAEAHLLAGNKSEAAAIAGQILAVNPEDETALELRNKGLEVQE